jgi:hypothetical protein
VFRCRTVYLGAGFYPLRGELTMSAGLNKKQIYNRIYVRLQKMSSNVRMAGGTTFYSKGELSGEYKSEPYCVWFNVQRASNGEVAGFVQVAIDKEIKAEFIHVLEGREK